METQVDVDALVTRVASATLRGHGIARVSSAPTVDMDGVDAIHVTIVLSEEDDTITGDAALNTIVDVRHTSGRNF